MLFRFALIRDRCGFLCSFFRVAKIIVPDGLQLIIEFVNQRQASRNVQFGDFGIRDIIEIFHQRADGIAVRNQQDSST